MIMMLHGKSLLRNPRNFESFRIMGTEKSEDKAISSSWHFSSFCLIIQTQGICMYDLLYVESHLIKLNTFIQFWSLLLIHICKGSWWRQLKGTNVGKIQVRLSLIYKHGCQEMVKIKNHSLYTMYKSWKFWFLARFFQQPNSGRISLILWNHILWS